MLFTQESKNDDFDVIDIVSNSSSSSSSIIHHMIIWLWFNSTK